MKNRTNDSGDLDAHDLFQVVCWRAGRNLEIQGAQRTMVRTDSLPCTVPSPCGIITLTTDFGTGDSYAGALKGVLLSINPECRPIDLTHCIPAHDIQTGALYLAQACALFPAGTVHLAVVDPGVGSGRRPLIVVTDRHYFVGPDNGLFTGVIRAAAAWACIEPDNPAYFRSDISTTFHGRDVFAPVSAHITRRIPVCAMGRPVDDPVLLEIPMPVTAADGSTTGTIVHIDRFGNLITNVPAKTVNGMAQQEGIVIECGKTVIRKLYSAYAQAGEGELFAIIGSSGRLEISIKNKSARQALNARCGQSVTLRPDALHGKTKTER